MRIIGGQFKGSNIYIPKSKDTRPLKDLVRESIFNLMDHSNQILFNLKQSNVLDLYAGTGSFGLECLSRQAKRVFFIENQKEVIEILKKNIDKLKLENKTKIISNNIFDIMKKENFFESKFDLIFCDPPYKDNNTEELVQLIFNKVLLKKNGLIIIHKNKSFKKTFPSFLKIVDERVYGISKIFFWKNFILKIFLLKFLLAQLLADQMDLLPSI